MVNHEIGELRTADQDDGRFDGSCVRLSFLRELGSGEEDPLARSLSLQSAGEPLNLGSTDRTLPTLRLNIDGLKAESILLDDSVDAPVPASAYGPAGIFVGSAVPHGQKEVDDELLEKCRGHRGNATENLFGQGAS